MSTQLFRQDDHLCVALTEHACGGARLQATRFLVLAGAATALIVSGGTLGFEDLRRAISPFVHPDDLELIVCTQPIDAQAQRFRPWLQRTCVTFVGIHSDPAVADRMTASRRVGRFVYVPEAGGRVALCERSLTLLPAASAGVRKLQVFDPCSRLLFDCDAGARYMDAPITQQRVA